MKHTKKIIALAVIALSAAAVLYPSIAYADGWEGSGGFSSYSGAGDASPCSGSDSQNGYANWYRLDCTGWSWIWYKYNGSGTRNPTFYNTGVFNQYSSDHVSISSKCADIGGFWHAGYNGRGYYYNRFITSTLYTSSYSTTYGAWGHWGTLNMGQARGDGTLKSPLGHTVGGYSANKNASKSNVWGDYVRFRAYMGYSAVSSWPSNLWGFCYGSVMEEQTADYTAQSSVSGSNGDMSSVGGAYSIVFLHQVKKTGASPSSYNPGTNWSVSGAAPTSNGNKKPGANWETTWNPNITGVLTPGQTLTLCQKMNYQYHVSSNASNSRTADTANQCRTVNRQIADSFTGGVKVKVDGVERSTSGTTETVDITGSAFTVSFQHTINRGDDAANGTATSDWSTSVSGKDPKNRDVTPRGNAHSGSVTLEENKSSDVVTFDTETFTGTLYPDETKTYCQTLTYEWKIDATGGDRTTSTTRCVNVHRVKSACGDGVELGINNGRNKGQISVRKTATNASTNWLDSGYKDTGDTIIRAWAKPDNYVHFKEEMCEGAEASNQYYELNKDITYAIDATNNTYMDGLNPYSWNNSSIKGEVNMGKDIWGGNTYTKTTYSPATSNQSTKYKIEESQLGTSFQQRLSWTDLWIDGSHSINSAHNGTKAATATAEVHIPYNYTLNPLTSSNNNPYLMPGTNTYQIEPTITVEDRINQQVNGDTAYATKTKESKYQVISYYIPRTATSAGVGTSQEYFSGRNVNGDTNLAGVCTSYTSGGAYNCRQLASGSGVYNPGTTTLNSINITVDENIPLGVKVCTVIAVWPSDSHNKNGIDITNEDDQWGAITARENTSQRKWRISQPTCSTVAKKPNFHVYNSGAYAEDQINTAVSNRTHPDGSKRSYGSWSEYEVVSARKPTLGLASGASLWGGIATQNDPMKYCYVSSLTLTNNNCAASGSGRYVGQKGVNKLIASDPENIYNQIITRYTRTDADDSGVGSVGSTYNLQIEGACEYDERRGIYVPKAINGSPTPSFSCLANGAYYTKVKGNAATSNGTQTVCNGWSCSTYVSEMWTSTDGEHSSNTYVTHVKGTLYINQNFHYGNITDLENTRYTNISEIPQTIFIAKDIKISSNVDHLDAWLIAENSIDTCYPADGRQVSVDNCNTQLTVTGPVLAKKLLLNRTYGGGTTTSTSTNTAWWMNEDSQSAERFILNPFTYLWSYSQSQRYSQAITTYSKELPTRF